MKLAIITLFVLTLTSSWSQTIVFEKNKEMAIVNEREGTSTTLTTTIALSAPITEEQFLAIEPILAEKDGYISLTWISKSRFSLTYESWIVLDDFYRILSMYGYVFKLAPTSSEESEKK